MGASDTGWTEQMQADLDSRIAADQSEQGARARLECRIAESPPAVTLLKEDVEETCWRSAIDIADHHYLYRDEHIFDDGSSFEAFVFNGQRTVFLDEGELTTVIGMIDEIINQRIAFQAVHHALCEEI